MDLVVYGDFNCPYSSLASARVDVLVGRGLADVEWRAVEHDPAIPRAGAPVDGERRAGLERELAEVRSLLGAGETFDIRRPPVLPNTAPAVAALAAAPPEARSPLRRALFTALWVDGRDIGDARVLRDVGAPDADRARPLASGWRDAWLDVGPPMVPTLVRSDGAVARGLDALAWLAAVPPPAADDRTLH